MRPRTARTNARLPNIAAALALSGLASACWAADPSPPDDGAGFPTRLLWGDTHVHSSWSADAGSFGNRRLGPDAAYRFARGEEVVAHNGRRARLRRPLDFLMVSDHAEYLGLYPLLEAADPDLLATPTGRRLAELFDQGRFTRIGDVISNLFSAPAAPIRDLPFTRTMWERVIANAERHNEPGRFTAFVGYEWTSMPDTANLHRNVLFRDGAEATGQVVPFSAIDSEDPEDLWRFLEDYERRTGGRALAIPHNANVSAARMFELQRFGGGPMTAAYAEARARWEPIVEVTQIKGDSETAPYLSPDDEFADFGTWDGMRGMGKLGHTDAMYAGEYVRAALGNGLSVERATGRNPFRFGLIGSTDAHTGLATADDDNFWGKFSLNEPRAGRAAEPWVALDPAGGWPVRTVMSWLLPSQMYGWSLLASGYAGVWARANTREEIFDALARREVYATTGPRIAVRFFGGFAFVDEDAHSADLAAVGYAKGVPMGGEIAGDGQGRTPTFLLSALRDPLGAHLDRVQIIKLHEAAGGEIRERIHDIAVSDGREVEADGRCRTLVGNTVDIDTATYSNSIGAAALTAVWRDPDFDATQRAVYYARVIEIPTPHWTTYDAARFGTERPAEAPATIQQRAYTSPIWYRPPTVPP